MAGTKGKGSTCAFTQSFLRAHGKRTGFPRKTGLYTSPHLKTIRERIQIDSKPIGKELFTRYFYEVWNGLIYEDTSRPRFLQLLMLVAIHTFISEKVEVAIFETHNGGEYDATNIFTNPIATGIATIGMDHVAQLGPSIENIAWHKAGIFKTGSPAFSVSQEHQAAAVLQRRAFDKDVRLEFVRDDLVDNADTPAMKSIVQRKNASLAVRLADAFISQKSAGAGHCLTSYDISEGIENFSWIGRFQQIVQGSQRWFLDGAHNEMSVPYPAQWFAEIMTKDLRL